MIAQVDKKRIQSIAIFGMALAALFISPSYSAEPVDLPKLLILTVFSFVLFGYLIQYSKVLIRQEIRLIFSVLVLFIIDMAFVVIYAGAPFNQQFFGGLGRNTGMLAYLGLVGVLLASMLVSDEKFLRNLSFGLITVGILNFLYGSLQTFNQDPVKWNNPYNSIIGFLGNPDFASSFLGFSSAVVISLILFKGTKWSMRVWLVVYEILNLLLIVRSHAQQGILVSGIVGGTILTSYLAKNKKIPKFAFWSFFLAEIVIGISFVLGIFRVGPLSAILYKASVRQRGFYWHAAVDMMKSHPIFGIGLDSYGENYFSYKSANANFHNAVIQSNAAHNVYLDFASNGGVPLILLYILINVLVFVAGIRVLRRANELNPYFIAIFAAWIGYQAQSLISINQLGLAVWGWGLGGAILGFSVNTSKIQDAKPKIQPSKGRKTSKKSSSLLFPLVGLLIGLAVAFPPYQTDHNYRAAQSSRDANRIIASTLAYPEDINRSINTAQLLANSKLFPQALKLAKHVTSISPKSYNAWVIISQIEPAGSAERANAISQMRKLNPQDKTIK